ncbi:unnamed protein product [Bemisia tabaci]|uniref:Uncharacterized protein n=1 Tax=Bemisia tabaci TaxID=7038 RepID=A0A9P0F4H0_BEMTA|nr:unnamed protein product [Bemisia tabaci]
MNNIKDEALREEAIFNALKAEKIQTKQAHIANGKLSAGVRTNNDEVEDKTIEQIAHGQASWMNNIKDEALREEAIFNALKAEKIQTKQAHIENGKLSAGVRQLESVVNKVLPVLAIRQKIEVFEVRYGLDLRSVPDNVKFKGIPGNYIFHTKTCLAIFNKTENAGVKRVIKLLKDENLTVEQFCDVLGYFFVFASENIHIPRMEPYTEEDILQSLNYLNIRDPATTKAVLVLWNSV